MILASVVAGLLVEFAQWQASRQIVAGISPTRARPCSRTGSRSPSIARWQMRRASSSGLMLPLPLVLRVIHASSKAYALLLVLRQEPARGAQAHRRPGRVYLRRMRRIVYGHHRRG